LVFLCGNKTYDGVSVATRWKCFQLVLKDSQDVDLVLGKKIGLKLLQNYYGMFLKHDIFTLFVENVKTLQDSKLRST